MLGPCGVYEAAKNLCRSMSASPTGIRQWGDLGDGEAADDEGCSFILVSTALFEKEEEDGETSDDLLSPTEPPVFIEGIDISTGEEVDEVWKGDLETGVGAVLYDS